ncbi:MAG: hypothetical protein AAGB46_00670 [Verrucomicrobiota bacterium]
MKRNPIQAEWAEAPFSRQVAYSVGILALLSGIAHLAAFPFIENASWSGPAGLRKTTIFGISTGLTLITMAWLFRYFQTLPKLHSTILYTMSAALFIEIIIIDLQRFRGVPSHFNMSTPFDAALWSTMGFFILVFAIVATAQAVLAFGKLNASPAMASAIRSSLILFFFSQVSGQLIVSHGLSQVVQNGEFVIENIAASTTYGEAGNLKLPHAITLHSIQAIPLLGLLIAPLAIPANRQRFWVWTSATGFLGVSLIAQVQAYLGKSIQNLDTPTSIALVLSLCAFGMPFFYALIAHLKRILSSRSNAKVDEVSQISAR